VKTSLWACVFILIVFNYLYKGEYVQDPDEDYFVTLPQEEYVYSDKEKMVDKCK